MPLNTATLLISAPASTAVASSVLIFTGLAGLARLSTSTAPACAFTTKRRLLAASNAGISAALTSYWPVL